MALKKVGPNQWRIKVSVRVQGKSEPVKKQETFTGTKTEAEGRISEIIKECRDTPSSLTSTRLITFADVLQLYREKKFSFAPSHEWKYEHLKKELGQVLIENFADTFESYIARLRNTPIITGKEGKKRSRKRSNATINRFLEITRASFNLAVELKLLSENPITKARFPKLEEKPRDRFLNEDERVRLLNTIREHRPHILPIIEYMLLVPCRKNELITAKKEQYNQFNNTIYIPDSKAGIPIYKPVPDCMKSYFRSIPSDCPYLFYRKDENGYHQLGTLQKPWVFCLKKAGLTNVRIHDCRHISASLLYEKGNSERMIMDIAGWKTPMLSTYRHKDSLRSAQQIKFTTNSEKEEKAGCSVVNV